MNSTVGTIKPRIWIYPKIDKIIYYKHSGKSQQKVFQRNRVGSTDIMCIKIKINVIGH